VYVPLRGIDFGTTHTVVAACDRGNYPVVAFTDPAGDALEFVPSVIAERAGEPSAPASAPTVTATPPDPASAGFEERLSELTAGAPPGARLTAGDVLTTHEDTVRRSGALRLDVRVRGTTLHAVSALLRSGDGRVLARGRLGRLRGRGRILLALPRGLRAGRYRVTLRGFAPNGAPLAASLRVVVRI